ncbi:hypothetical protein CDL15_Pgr022685 [Punica granatum]|uniref:Uncharacterized protein n=1 Tax=Punica granatum TaxID=22663 RepID=A0A218XRJ4_PUNGR|nr:hypothetical protein CDL15_Pgr022685 [Punica granatum]
MINEHYKGSLHAQPQRVRTELADEFYATINLTIAQQQSPVHVQWVPPPSFWVGKVEVLLDGSAENSSGKSRGWTGWWGSSKRPGMGGWFRGSGPFILEPLTALGL